MVVIGVSTCPHCGKAPAPGTDASGHPIFVCCPTGGERSYRELGQLPIIWYNASNPGGPPWEWPQTPNQTLHIS